MVFEQGIYRLDTFKLLLLKSCLDGKSTLGASTAQLALTRTQCLKVVAVPDTVVAVAASAGLAAPPFFLLLLPGPFGLHETAPAGSLAAASSRVAAAASRSGAPFEPFNPAGSQ